MKLIDALLNVKKDEPDDIDIELFFQEFNLNCGSIDYTKYMSSVKAYWIKKWYCSDTWVGMKAIYLNDELVGYLNQVGRKCGVSIKYVSEESAKKLKTFIEDLLGDIENFSIIDMNEEIGKFYAVDYTQQLLDKEGFYNGKRATYAGSGEPSNWLSEKIKVIIEGEDDAKFIPVSEFKIKINVDI